MVAKTPVTNGRSADDAREAGVKFHFTAMLRHVATLAELQTRLAAVDARDFVRRAKVPCVAALGAGMILVGSTSVVLAGLACVFAGRAGWSIGAALVLIGGIAVAICAVTLLSAARSLRSAAATFERSLDEWRTNVSWLAGLASHKPESRQGLD
ncbi:MAG: phage holin family protein [Planctomycetia bacterium]|nr:phage holin family protein [Planctomycetia bacterium]